MPDPNAPICPRCGDKEVLLFVGYSCDCDRRPKAVAEQPRDPRDGHGWVLVTNPYTGKLHACRPPPGTLIRNWVFAPDGVRAIVFDVRDSGSRVTWIQETTVVA